MTYVRGLSESITKKCKHTASSKSGNASAFWPIILNIFIIIGIHNQNNMFNLFGVVVYVYR